MSSKDLEPDNARTAQVFDLALFVGALGVMAVAVGVLIFHDGSRGERAAGLAHVFVGLIVTGAGVVMKMRSRPSMASEAKGTSVPLQPLLTTAFVLGVFAVLATLAMDRLLDGSAGMGERLMVISAAAFAWMLPVQVLRWNDIADETVGRAWLNAFLPGYFVLMAGATAALIVAFWRNDLVAPVLMLALAASAITVGGKFWLDRRSGLGPK